jgi:hypothetical protein
MPLNDTGMQLLADTLQANLLYGQLHDGLAGEDGTDNIVLPGREAAFWTTPVDLGDFGLISQMDFVGGTPGDPVYSVSLWDQPTDGTFYGEYVLTGDSTFNIDGEFSVTAIDWVGSVEGS